MTICLLFWNEAPNKISLKNFYKLQIEKTMIVLDASLLFKIDKEKEKEIRTVSFLRLLGFIF